MLEEVVSIVYESPALTRNFVSASWDKGERRGGETDLMRISNDSSN